MTSITLDGGLLHLAERAGQRLTQRGDGAVLEFTADLETIHEVTHGDDSYQVRVISRGQRGRPIISSREQTQVEKYLTWVFGWDVRHGLGLPLMTSLADLDLPEGVTLDVHPDFSYVLHWTGGGAAHDVTFGQETAARRFAQYARASRSELEASMLSADGGPLFTVRTDEPGRGDDDTPWYRRRRRSP